MQPAPGGRRANRIEIGGFDKHRGGVLGAPGGGAADHPGQCHRSVVVGDHRHIGIEIVALVVERRERLARARQAYVNIAGERIDIEDVQRARAIVSDEIGNIDQRRDRSQTDRGQAALQPRRARPIAQAADHPPNEQRAGIGGLGIEVETHADRAFENAGNRIDRTGFQAADAGCREVARNAENTEAVAAIGGDRDIDDRIVEPGKRREGRADRRVVGELDNAFVLVADAHLALRAQHAESGNAANRALFQGYAGARDGRADWRENAFHARPRIRRAAHHVEHLAAGIDLADPQPIGVGVLLGGLDIGDGERRQGGAAVDHLLDLEAEHGQPVGNLVEGRVGLEMGLEPVQGELHRLNPWPSVGVSRAAKP